MRFTTVYCEMLLLGIWLSCDEFVCPKGRPDISDPCAGEIHPDNRIGGDTRLSFEEANLRVIEQPEEDECSVDADLVVRNLDTGRKVTIRHESSGGNCYLENEVFHGEMRARSEWVEVWPDAPLDPDASVVSSGIELVGQRQGNRFIGEVVVVGPQDWLKAHGAECHVSCQSKCQDEYILEKRDFGQVCRDDCREFCSQMVTGDFWAGPRP